jgi:uncharacterized repeat protein (TIGR03803 family)
MNTTFAALLAGMVGCAFVRPISVAEAAKFKEKVLWSFGNGTDGQYASASLIDVKGTFYSTTGAGGTYGGGAVFALDQTTGVEQVLYSFCRQDSCADGLFPSDSLINVKGVLYGTTVEGGGTSCGGAGCGTVFALDPRTGAERVLYAFCSQYNCADGSDPFAGLIDVKGVLYGTTDEGGTSEFGTVFALDPKTGTETVLYSFCSQQNCADGQNPGPPLIAVSGILYGTTVAGGTYGCGSGQGCGAAFSLDPSTGAETVVHSFGNGTDGRVPEASLINVNGILYGTTDYGMGTGCGGSGCGTVFSLDPSTGAETVFHSFLGGTDGANPFASLINVNGTLYGTTYAGGGEGCDGGGCGTVFSIDSNTDAEKVLYSFQGGTDGANPTAGLINVKGVLYGTTQRGGIYGYGTVFALKKMR